MLQIDNLSVRYGNLVIVQDINLQVSPGQWWMVIGPNGAGKSTLLGAVSQSIAYEGRVMLGGSDLADLRPNQRARWVGVLAQTHSVGYSYTVEEIVTLGRYAYSQGALGGLTEEDREIIHQSLGLTGLLAQRNQSVLTLSGGELQRTFLAQVLAQQPRILLLDEPSNHLDLRYQKEVFYLVERWLQQPGRAVVSVVHDLSLARSFGSHALLMEGGRAVAQGEIESVFGPANLEQAYSMDVYGWMQSMLGQWRR